jgi:mono/diheme cytochrome c family protein
MRKTTMNRWTVLLLTIAAVARPVRAEVDYQKQVRPFLAEHCWQCHGVDEKDRQGGLRLDDRASAVKGGDSGSPAIVAGNPDASEILKRLASHDPDVMMPPPAKSKRPTAAEADMLRQWITEGAVYEQHWSFTPPQKQALPTAGVTNPIDSFVADRLRKEGLDFAPEASVEILCRRLYLDLVGLPPSPAQLQQFRERGLEAVAEELLTSRGFGEKWARQWLDLARYSDTNGYEKDLQREQWIWRDWVIDAVVADMPWNQFIIEQIAGDLLPNAGQSQLIATGFLRNSMINEEGAIPDG